MLQNSREIHRFITCPGLQPAWVRFHVFLPAILLICAMAPREVDNDPLQIAKSKLEEDPFRNQRHEMVSGQLERRGIRHQATLEAMRNVPRHEFVPENRKNHAYMDSPLPIGYGQTISQPYIVAYMTELVRPEPGQRILEIGTGSGYQAAVLAEIIDDVFTIEIIEELAEWGSGNLMRSGYGKVNVKHADGYYGWEEHAPFDAIIVTAASDHIPSPLVEQLADGGRMVIPVGNPFQTQMLMLVEKDGEDIITQSLMPVRFVPFVRGDNR